MFEICKKRADLLIAQFALCKSQEERYLKIIEMGAALPPMDSSAKTADRLVEGCQSLMYLEATYKAPHIHFQADSDALISKGIAAILLFIYSDAPLEALFKFPLTFLDEMQIFNSLSMNRSNGLRSLFLKMQRAALPFLVKNI